MEVPTTAVGREGIMSRLTWQAVALIGVIAAVVVAMATLTDWGSGEVLALVGILGGLGGGAAVAGGVAGGVDQLRVQTEAQTTTLDTVARRVNGDLDARIDAGADRAAAKVLGVLRDNGVVP
jgi:hypothetical protein